LQANDLVGKMAAISDYLWIDQCRIDGCRTLWHPIMFWWKNPCRDDLLSVAQTALRRYWQWGENGLEVRKPNDANPDIILIFNDAIEVICRWSVKDEPRLGKPNTLRGYKKQV
jgi:hypothetical protein